jgi:hypothetical protein
LIINNSFGPLVESLPLTKYDTQPRDAEEENSGASAVELAFVHPTLLRTPTVWLPQDWFGIAEEEKKASNSAGVRAAVGNAVINENGQVDVHGPPPEVETLHIRF